MEQTRRIVHRMPSADMFRTSQYAAPKKVVAAYARVSTEKEEQEDSFERQVEHYTKLITSNPECCAGHSEERKILRQRYSRQDLQAGRLIQAQDQERRYHSSHVLCGKHPSGDHTEGALRSGTG